MLSEVKLAHQLQLEVVIDEQYIDILGVSIFQMIHVSKFTNFVKSNFSKCVLKLYWGAAGFVPVVCNGLDTQLCHVFIKVVLHLLLWPS